MNKVSNAEVQGAIKSIQKCLISAQNFFYYHEEDQLKNKDQRGWNSLEYIEHVNLILYHQMEVMKSVENSSKGILLPNFLRIPLDTLSYAYLQRKKQKEILYKKFIPVSISNPGVQLYAQKVFEDLIYGGEELIRLSENYSIVKKIVVDPKIPGFLSIEKKLSFIADYMSEIVDHCKILVK
ncbi:hypothetical protein JCM31826_12910 [Thermaurantimonas aggregans]|uniref:DinB-like domain-containing protein n=1 Tax=Thermaurantimonas aggregans TaxID=2173829 RepID=A0A401XLB4_9FLAO|nr:hypothetical protein [Thermaurantimonas aggregans]MCX8148304.1 hypothetical protein [Thermaurantimonas aggregans]GCD77809.1 hypothetical protein JCM31826_12910 [Thermaurantimonas aggregans]